MLVRLEDLKANPFRDFKVDPIDEAVVANLKASIEDDGFWGGIVCRRVNGAIQIGAGHHRVIAAMQAGIEESDVFVAEEMSDACHDSRLCPREHDATGQYRHRRGRDGGQRRAVSGTGTADGR